MTIKDNVNEVRENIAKAALRVGRNPEDVTLCAVSKYIDVPRIKEALEARCKFSYDWTIANK